ncbi:MAG TPA: VWA domain-containing protein [Bryobacteraceae bacterium]|nr:VWA domain-containing protein [Bryobacteraceae bacterium]
MTIGRKLLGGIMAAGCTLALQAPLANAADNPPEQVRLVRLHVVATDIAGKPVGDLEAADIKVRDQNKDRRIAEFHAEVVPPAAAGEISNRFIPSVRPATIILIDLLNPERQAQLEGLKDLRKTLEQTKSGESLFLYRLNVDGTVEALHPTEDWAKTDWMKDVASLLDKAGKEAGMPKPAGQTVEGTTKETYVALEKLSDKLALFPGPRQIVWLSYNIPNVLPSQAASDGDRAQTDYQGVMGGVGAHASRMEDAVGVPWAPGSGDTSCKTGIWVDCGLYVPHLTSTLEKNNTAIYNVNYEGTLDPGWVRGNEQFANAVAGRWFQKDTLTDAMAQAAGDAQGGYTLAFEQPKEGWDGKYHPLKLICSRKGVTLVTRDHFFAPKDTRDAAAREQGALVAAFNAPGNVSDIGLRASLTRGAGADALRLKLRVDAADLHLTHHGDAYDGQVTVSWVRYGASGLVGSPGMAHPTLHFTSAEMSAAMKDGIAIDQDVPVDGTIKAIRLFVVDRTTCIAGSLFIPLGR